jgi:hypothetical protein
MTELTTFEPNNDQVTENSITEDPKTETILEQARQELLKQNFQQDNFYAQHVNITPEQQQALQQKEQLFRERNGQNPTRKQVEEFYKQNGLLNCSLVVDWYAAYLREETGIMPRKITIYNRKRDDKEGPPSPVVRHAMLEINHKGESFFYNVTGGQKFQTSNDIEKYMQSVFPQPNHYVYSMGYAA